MGKAVCISATAKMGCMLLSALLVGQALLAAGVPLTEHLRQTGATVESKGLEIAPFRIVFADDRWQARDVAEPLKMTGIAVHDSSELDPELGEIVFAFTENEESGRLTIWVAAGSGEHQGRLEPFLVRVQGAAVSTLDWDVALTFGSDLMLQPDRDRIAVWAHRHAARIDDVAFLGSVAEHIWHNQELDDPPGSYNRIIDLNSRALEIDPHEVDLYGTNAWLLWSKWVSWGLDPTRMPDGETKLDEALALLARGDKANPGDAEFLLEAGCVLIPVVKSHRRDLVPLLENYLRRAAETAEDTDLAIRARRTYAGQLFVYGKVNLARQWYRKLLDLDPESEVATRRLRELDESKRAPAPEGRPPQ